MYCSLDLRRFATKCLILKEAFICLPSRQILLFKQISSTFARYTISCMQQNVLIQHIVVTLISRSKTVVEIFPIAAICRVLPNKPQQEHVFYLLPWQMKQIFITLFITLQIPQKSFIYHLFLRFLPFGDFHVNLRECT